MLEGDLSQAAALFRRTLALEPDHIGARSYLGLALAETGQSEAALYHYRFAISQNLPDDVAGPIRRYIAQHNTGTGVGGFAYLNIGRETNPWQQGGLDRVIVGDFEFLVPSSSGPEPETVLEFGGGVRGRTWLAERARLFGSLRVDVDRYVESDFTNTLISPKFAVEFVTSDKSELSIGVEAEIEYAEDQEVRREYGPSASFAYRHSDGLRGFVSAAWFQIETPGREYAYGRSREVALGGEAVLAPDLALYAAGSFYRRNLDRRRIGYDEWSALLGVRKILPWGLRLDGRLQIEDRLYHAASQIFGIERHDFTGTGSVSLGSAALSFHGYSPEIRFEREVRSSNIEFYNASNNSIAIELTRAF